MVLVNNEVLSFKGEFQFFTPAFGFNLPSYLLPFLIFLVIPIHPAFHVLQQRIIYFFPSYLSPFPRQGIHEWHFVCQGIYIPGKVSDSSTSSPFTFNTLVQAHIDGTTDFSCSPVPTEVASCESSVGTANGDLDAYDTPEALRKIEFELSLDDDYDSIKEKISPYSGKDYSQPESYTNFRGEPMLDMHGIKADRSGYEGRDDDSNSYMLLQRTGLFPSLSKILLFCID